MRPLAQGHTANHQQGHIHTQGQPAPKLAALGQAPRPRSEVGGAGTRSTIPMAACGGWEEAIRQGAAHQHRPSARLQKEGQKSDQRAFKAEVPATERGH